MSVSQTGIRQQRRYYPGLIERGDGTALIHTQSRRYFLQANPFRVLDITGPGVRAVTPCVLLDQGLVHLRVRSPLSGHDRLLKPEQWYQSRGSPQRPVAGNWVQLPSTLLAQIPESSRQAVLALPSQHCRLLRSLSLQGQEFRELLLTSPAVALLLACPGIVGRHHQNLQRFITRWSKKPRRIIITKALGFGAGMTHLLCNLKGEVCSAQLLRRLYEFSHEQHRQRSTLKQVRHAVHELNGGWVRLLMSAWSGRGLYTEAVVWQAMCAAPRAASTFERAASRIREDDRMLRMKAPSCLTGAGIRDLSTFVAAAAQAGCPGLEVFGPISRTAQKRVQYQPYAKMSPSLSIPQKPRLREAPSIVHLPTVHAVVAAGQKLNNCLEKTESLARYLQRMTLGGGFYLLGEKCSHQGLAVVIADGDPVRFQLLEACGPMNKRLPAALRRTLIAWAHEENILIPRG